MEEKDKIIVKWAQEDVETSNNLLNNNQFQKNPSRPGIIDARARYRAAARRLRNTVLYDGYTVFPGG